ncbi:MAG TPA: type II secretion system protein GspC [Kofleriaceae bacterium]
MNRGPSRRAAAIAIGAAIVALAISVIAVFVVANRGGEATKVEPVAASEAEAQTVPAVEVVKLAADAVEVVREAGKVIGVKVLDDKLRKKLGLEPGDVITAVSGRPVKRELDVYESIVGLSMIDTKELFVEIVRNKQARLVRWRLEGDLRLARKPPDPPRDLDIYGGTIGTLPSNPYVDDPLFDTIVKVDDFNYTIPRKTVDQFTANPASFMRGARIVPSMKNGKPQGIKLYAIRPTSPYAKLGFTNGDTVQAVNGFEIDSMDRALEIYTQLRDAKELRFQLERRGKPVELTIKII